MRTSAAVPCRAERDSGGPRRRRRRRRVRGRGGSRRTPRRLAPPSPLSPGGNRDRAGYVASRSPRRRCGPCAWRTRRRASVSTPKPDRSTGWPRGDRGGRVPKVIAPVKHPGRPLPVPKDKVLPSDSGTAGPRSGRSWTTSTGLPGATSRRRRGRREGPGRRRATQTPQPRRRRQPASRRPRRERTRQAGMARRTTVQPGTRARGSLRTLRRRR